MEDFMEIIIPQEKITKIFSADICVIGGSCTGVFAAIRAARLGAKVILVEQQNRFGGVATLGLVGMWHSLFDINGEQQIIGGLTYEVMERLEKRNSISPWFRDGCKSLTHGIRFNTEELTLELDDMICAENNIRYFLQSRFSRAVLSKAGDVEAVVLENKSGRFAVKADMFIDASGDGVLCREAQMPLWKSAVPQPPTSCARFGNWNTLGGHDLKELIEKYRKELPDLPCGYFWSMDIPGTSDMMFAGTRVMNCDCSDGEAVSRAEVEARRQIRALMDMYRREFPDNRLSLSSLPSAIGIREGEHINSFSRLEGEEMLAGTYYPDTIGCGTYPVDVHGNGNDSITFWRLTGDKYIYHATRLIAQERWLPKGEVLPYYCIPLRSQIPAGAENIISAGRMIDADGMAFGAVRVMVNLNQCGEAAGVAAWLALHRKCGIRQVDGKEVRKLLNKGGSCVVG